MATVEADDVGVGDSVDCNALENWMGNLPSHLLDVPLHTLAIPGSHNSGAYQLMKEWEVSPDADQAVRNLSSLPMARDIIHNWSKCQNLSIPQQLKAGVRFLDLRVALYKPTEELHFVHSMYGPKVSACMEEVRSFTEKHNKEVVLLDFNHFYGMELEHHIQLITYLMFVFDGLLCQYSSLGTLTLSSLREKGTRVIIFYNHSSVMEFSDLWPSHAIKSAWADTSSVDACLSYHRKAAKERQEDRFHVCQLVLTPGIGDIMQKFHSSLQKECAQKINPQLCQWMSCDEAKGCTGMVYTADFVEESNFVQNVLDLNK